MIFTQDVCDWFKGNLFDGNYLEIGVYDGDSLRQLALHYPEKTIYGVDPFIEDGCTTHHSGIDEGGRLSDQMKSTLSNIKGIKNVRLIRKTSISFRQSLTTHKIYLKNIGAVFIDGSHHYKDAVNDFQLAMQLIGDKEGIIAVDDLQVPDVLKSYNEFKKRFKNRISNLVCIRDYCHALHINSI